MKEFLSRKGIPYTERDLTRDPSAIDELRRIGAMATPVTVIDNQAVVGFDEPTLNRLLSGTAPKSGANR